MYGRKQTFLRWFITVIIFSACVVPAHESRADSGEWTWVNGSDTLLQPGIYGEQGIPDAANVPGARYGSFSWTDTVGDFWLFGGYGPDSAGIEDLLNDLWRYDPDNNTWTWINGSDTVLQPGTYGEQGIPDAANVPGARYGGVSWTDTAGDLWLFAGFGLDSTGGRDYLNDLWRYDPDNNTWTWINGSETVMQPGTYGEQGIPNAANVPGARYESAAWTDNGTGDLLLFGGYGLDNGTREDILNDLWRYDPDNNTWTWINGSDDVIEEGIYGEQGIPDADNMPGSRYNPASWTDRNGDLWLFGGYGMGRDYMGYLNDLWRYDPDNNTWTWINGSKKPNKSGIYGAQGMPAERNMPGSRYDAVSWTDHTGDLWLFGGYGYASSGRDNLNDLWRYDPDTDTWTWISGSDRPEKFGIYGTQGIPSAANMPGARNGSAAWVGSAGDLWLFGGYNYFSSKFLDYANDLWSFELPADMNMRIDTCSIKAGTTDAIKFSGFIDAGEPYMNAAMGAEIVISLWTDRVPDPDATTFRFPINADTYTGGKYKSPKIKPADKSDPVLSFSYDSAKGAMTFSGKNVDLTGLYCPITLTIEIGSFFVQRTLQEDIVNGPKKPCPLPLIMGVLDSLDVAKFKAKKGSRVETDSFLVSGTFTVDGSFDFDTLQPVDITLGPDMFSVPGGVFVEKKGAYTCKNADSGTGLVTAKFDTVKCTYSIKIKNASLNGTGDVGFGVDLFGYALQAPGPVTLPDAF